MEDLAYYKYIYSCHKHTHTHTQALSHKLTHTTDSYLSVVHNKFLSFSWLDDHTGVHKVYPQCLWVHICTDKPVYILSHMQLYH